MSPKIELKAHIVFTPTDATIATRMAIRLQNGQVPVKQRNRLTGEYFNCDQLLDNLMLAIISDQMLCSVPYGGQVVSNFRFISSNPFFSKCFSRNERIYYA